MTTIEHSRGPNHPSSERMAAAVRTVADSTPDKRRVLTERLVAEFQPLFRRIARDFANRPGFTWANDGEALTSLVAEVAWRLLDADSTDSTDPHLFPDLLRCQARSAIRELAESGNTTGFAAMSGRVRRGRSLHRDAPRLAQMLGHQPSTAELIEFHNCQVRAQRSDPAKQGAYVSRDDLADTRMVLADPATLAEEVAASLGEDCPLTAFELRRVLDQVFAECARVSRRTEAVARAWALSHLSDQPTSYTAVGQLVGWSENTVKRELAVIVDIARQVLTRRWGIGA